MFKDLKENLDIMKEKIGDLVFTIRMNNKKKNKKTNGNSRNVHSNMRNKNLTE